MLNNDNYFSKEANMSFCSASQYKSFFRDIPPMPACEERTLAELNMEWKRDTSDSLSLGSFVDCMLLEPEKLEGFKVEHPEMFSSKGATKGELKSNFKKGELMVDRVKKSELFMRFINNSKHQEIMTGVIEGVPVKIKIDCLGDKFIFDLKTTQSIDKAQYNSTEKEWQTFSKAFGYEIQGAIYREVVRQNTGKTLPFIIGAVSSEKHPAIDIFEIDTESLDTALEEVKQYIVSVPLLKAKKVPAKRCERCDYCKDTRVITKIGDWLGREETEDD